jgi:hypothetical protein
MSPLLSNYDRRAKERPVFASDRPNPIRLVILEGWY